MFDTRFSNIDFILAENMTFGINKNANIMNLILNWREYERE